MYIARFHRVKGVISAAQSSSMQAYFSMFYGVAVRAVQFVCLLLCVVTVSQGQQGECLCTVCSTVTVLWSNSLPVSGINQHHHQQH